jgi:cation diffusion facilitator family transporter
MKASKTAALSVFSNSFIVLLKLVIGIVTGSVAIISEAIHSSLDLMASMIAFFSVQIANRPADEKHAYGHGKVENISGTIETILIFVAGIWIIYECIQKILHPEPIQLPFLGIIIMLIGALLNFLVSRRVKRIADETNSVAMHSNAFHLLTDVFTSLGVAISLALVTVTGWTILDPIIGIALALYIMKEALEMWKVSFSPLLDERLSEEEEDKIRKIIESYRDQYIEYHDFRTRRSGAEEHVDFHLIVPSNISIGIAHRLCDKIEADIKKVLYKPQILIHIEPEEEQKGDVN